MPVSRSVMKQTSAAACQRALQAGVAAERHHEREAMRRASAASAKPWAAREYSPLHQAANRHLSWHYLMARASPSRARLTTLFNAPLRLETSFSALTGNEMNIAEESRRTKRLYILCRLIAHDITIFRHRHSKHINSLL